MIVSIDQIKEHLNIESDFTDDDVYLTGLTEVAEESIIEYLNLPTGYTGYTSSADTPLGVQQAIKLFVAHLYINRQMVSFAQGVEIPYTFTFLLSRYRYPIIK